MSLNLPLPPGVNRITEQPDGKLTESETDFILTKCLTTTHRKDPNVMGLIAAYVRCRDRRQAAADIGIHWRQADVILKRKDVIEAIRQITDLSVQKYGYDASEVVARVNEIAQLDPGELEKQGGAIKRLSEMEPEMRRAIKKFKVKELFGEDPNGMPIVIGHMVEVEFWDKLKGLELLGREQNLFVEKKKVEVDIGANARDVLLESPDQKAARRRAELREVGPVSHAPAPQITHGGDDEVET